MNLNPYEAPSAESQPGARWRVAVVSIFLFVAGAALVGMVLGALFGLAAGLIGPSLFQRLIPWQDVEPVGFAVVLGAFGGVMCGGALGVFAVMVQVISEWLGRRRMKGT